MCVRNCVYAIWKQRNCLFKNVCTRGECVRKCSFQLNHFKNIENFVKCSKGYKAMVSAFGEFLA